MNTKPISPAVHGLLDYALVGSLLTLPSVMNMSDDVKKIYAAEAATLGVYIALTDHPTAVKSLIPFPVHGKIDPFNVALFAAQTFFGPFRRDKKARVFNIAFTALAAVTVLLTDWKGDTKRSL